MGEVDAAKLREVKQAEQLQLLVAFLQAGAAVAALYLILRRTKGK